MTFRKKIPAPANISEAKQAGMDAYRKAVEEEKIRRRRGGPASPAPLRDTNKDNAVQFSDAKPSHDLTSFPLAPDTYTACLCFWNASRPDAIPWGVKLLEDHHGITLEQALTALETHDRLLREWGSSTCCGCNKEVTPKSNHMGSLVLAPLCDECRAKDQAWHETHCNHCRKELPRLALEPDAERVCDSCHSYMLVHGDFPPGFSITDADIPF